MVNILTELIVTTVALFSNIHRLSGQQFSCVRVKTVKLIKTPFPQKTLPFNWYINKKTSSLPSIKYDYDCLNKKNASLWQKLDNKNFK